MKWKRFCPIKNELKLVRAENGGGIRLIEIPYDMNFSVNDLMQQAISLYFSTNNCNKFLESIEECTFAIVSPKGDVIDGDLELWPHIRNNGFVVSKSTFVLTSKSVVSYQLEDFAFIPSVCPNCSSSLYQTSFGNCLRCEASRSQTHATPVAMTSTPIAEKSSCATEDLLPQNDPPTFYDQNASNVINLVEEDSTVEETTVNLVNVEPALIEGDNVVDKIVAKIHRVNVVRDVMAYFKENKVSNSFF